MTPFSVPPGVMSRELDGQVVILDTVSGSYFRLNNSGALIWSHLGTADSLDDLVARLTAAYDVDHQVARDDVLELVAVLEERGLVLVER